MSSVPRPITTPSPTRPPAEAHSSAHPAGQREYLEDLTVPSKENLRRIDSTQRRKEVEVDRKYGHEEAAKIIQRNYRGFRVRRELQGLSLNPSSRWAEVRSSPRYKQCSALRCGWRRKGHPGRTISRRDNPSTTRRKPTRPQSRLSGRARTVATLQQDRATCPRQQHGPGPGAGGRGRRGGSGRRRSLAQPG